MTTSTNRSPRSHPAPRRPATRLVVGLVALLSVAACADDGPEATSGGAEPAATVTIQRSRFDATDIRVEVGATVEFINLDAVAHTVTSVTDAPVAFDSGDLGEDATFEVTFDEPGEYRYFCEIHPTMRGTIVVS
ncbi:MAG: plastocyanin/azurin family copper-binding protein [Ilumatobacteraceae bacterium]